MPPPNIYTLHRHVNNTPRVLRYRYHPDPEQMVHEWIDPSRYTRTHRGGCKYCDLHYRPPQSEAEARGKRMGRGWLRRVKDAVKQVKKVVKGGCRVGR
jgi:hypothetical protein